VGSDPARVMGVVERLAGFESCRDGRDSVFWREIFKIYGIQVYTHQDMDQKRPVRVGHVDEWGENDTSIIVAGEMATGRLLIHTFDMIVEGNRGGVVGVGQ